MDISKSTGVKLKGGKCGKYEVKHPSKVSFCLFLQLKRNEEEKFRGGNYVKFLTL